MPLGKEEDVVGRSSSVGKILHRDFLTCASCPALWSRRNSCTLLISFLTQLTSNLSLHFHRTPHPRSAEFIALSKSSHTSGKSLFLFFIAVGGQQSGIVSTAEQSCNQRHNIRCYTRARRNRQPSTLGHWQWSTLFIGSASDF